MGLFDELIQMPATDIHLIYFSFGRSIFELTYNLNAESQTIIAHLQYECVVPMTYQRTDHRAL